MQRAVDILNTYYGYEHFRPGQQELIDGILEGRDVLGVMPTGGGKSLCYQIPALLLDGTALIVSPLISLMKDQVDTLQSLGIQAAYINSQMDQFDYQETAYLLRSGQIKLLYVAPERLGSPAFLNLLGQIHISLVAVDEAHCISQWGQDFRPSYRSIVTLREFLGDGVPFAGFTATATNRVKEDIIQQLELREPMVYSASFDRPNLYFSVVQSTNKKRELVKQLDKDQSAIIYCNTRKNVEKVCEFLVKKGFPATYYHGGLAPEERSASQEDFLYDRKPIMVATNAFGMGIDKPDVRKVVHYNMPLDMESYYQEAGRAGRDGAPSEAVLFYSSQDILTNSFLIEQGNEPHAKVRLQKMTGYCKTGSCLRRTLLQYFDEEMDRVACDHCSNCHGETETIDITVDCQKILSCVYRMGQRFGTGMVTDVLRGKDTQRIRERQLEELSTYGILSEQSDGDIKDRISLMVGEGYLVMAGDSYPILQFTQKTPELLKGETTLSMVKRKNEKRKASRNEDWKSEEYDEELFEKLRQIRLGIANEMGKPPFVVFSDRSLIDMCAKLPTDEEAFLSVHGVGENKLKTYGNPFLEAIQEHVSV